jgi:hypothetical protein
VGSVAAVIDMLQEARAWLADRFSRLELLTEHTAEVLGAARTLVLAELTAIRAARAQLDI